MPVFDLFKLDDRVAIVTGASSGLGVAFARAFAEAGGQVAIAARRVDRLAEVAKDLSADGLNVRTYQTDVTDPEQCQGLVDGVTNDFGRVDILVNNAGLASIIRPTPG